MKKFIVLLSLFTLVLASPAYAAKPDFTNEKGGPPQNVQEKGKGSKGEDRGGPPEGVKDKGVEKRVQAIQGQLDNISFFVSVISTEVNSFLGDSEAAVDEDSAGDETEETTETETDETSTEEDTDTTDSTTEEESEETTSTEESSTEESDTTDSSIDGTTSEETEETTETETDETSTEEESNTTEESTDETNDSEAEETEEESENTNTSTVNLSKANSFIGKLNAQLNRLNAVGNQLNSLEKQGASEETLESIYNQIDELKSSIQSKIDRVQEVLSNANIESDENESEDSEELEESARNVVGNLLSQGYSLEEIIANLKNQEESELEEEEEDSQSEDEADEEEIAEDKAAEEETAEDKASKLEKKSYANAIHASLEAQKEQLKQHLESLKEESTERYEQELEAYQDLLEDLSDLYEESDDIESAFKLQTDAVKVNLKDLKSYKELAKLYEKKNNYKGIKAFVNGDHPNFDVPPVIQEGRTFIPFRAISEALQAEVDWLPEERAVVVEKDGKEVKLVIGVTAAFVNGEQVSLDVPAEIIDGRAVVPLRFISEAFGSTVEWDSETQSVVIVE